MCNRENELKKKTKNHIFSILKYRKDTYAQNEKYIYMHSFNYKEVLPYHCKVTIQHVETFEIFLCYWRNNMIQNFTYLWII